MHPNQAYITRKEKNHHPNELSIWIIWIRSTPKSFARSRECALDANITDSDICYSGIGSKCFLIITGPIFIVGVEVLNLVDVGLTKLKTLDFLAPLLVLPSKGIPILSEIASLIIYRKSHSKNTISVILFVSYSTCKIFYSC